MHPPRVWFPSRISIMPQLINTKRDFLRSILSSAIEDDVKHSELTASQFLTMSLYYQTNIYYTIQLIEILKHLSGIVVFISILLLQLIIGVPLLMLFAFLSSYSKKGFLKFWDIFPILGGIGYTILITRFYYVLYYIFFCALALMCMIDIAISPNIVASIANCKYDKTNLCLPMYPKEELNLNCSANGDMRNQSEVVFFSTQHYFRYRIMEYDSLHFFNVSFNFKLGTTIFFLWCIVFGLAIVGVKRIKKVTLALQHIFDYLMFFMTLVITFASYKDVKPYKMNWNGSPTFRYWVFLFIHAADVFILSDMIWVGRMKAKSLSVKQASWTVGLAKTLVFLLVLFYSRRSTQMVIGHYKITDPTCLVVYGTDVIYAFIPDILYRIYFGMFFSFLWYVILFWTSLNLSVYTVASTVNALLEQFNILRGYRFHLYLIYCILAVMSNMFLCTDFVSTSVYFFDYYVTCFIVIFCLLVVIFGLLFIYSIPRIMDDYMFVYAKYPNLFFVSGWKTTAIVVMATFIFMLNHVKYYAIYHFKDPLFIMLAHFKGLFLILPILLVFLLRCCLAMRQRRKTRWLSRLSQALLPSINWDPAENRAREARHRFYPQKTSRYLQTELQKCDHNCIVNLDTFRDVRLKEVINLKNLEKKIQFKTRTKEDAAVLKEIVKLSKDKRVKI